MFTHYVTPRFSAILRKYPDRKPEIIQDDLEALKLLDFDDFTTVKAFMIRLDIPYEEMDFFYLKSLLELYKVLHSDKSESMAYVIEQLQLHVEKVLAWMKKMD